MRYHYEKPELYFCEYGRLYLCDHPAYDRCTLYLLDGKGLAVIQQRFDAERKTTYWTEIDSWLADPLYLHPRFMDYFEKRARPSENGLYPTVTIRQIMWALKMKPLKREVWETAFDHCPI